MDKKQARIRRSKKTRAHIKELGVHRLCVHRTPRHLYVQLIAPSGNQVLASASTLDKDIRDSISGYTGNTEAAKAIGKAIAEKAKAVGVETAAFDRSGFRYHGRVKALADAARESGLQI